MDGYRAGDRDDFDRLYRTTYSRLLRILYAITGDATAAEDCVQEAYVRAFAAWGSAGDWRRRLECMNASRTAPAR